MSRAYITGFSDSHQPDDASTDLRNTYKRLSKAVLKTLPATTEMDQYFYLPLLGYYSTTLNNYKFNAAGVTGYYWSSSAVPTNPTGSYALTINNNTATLQESAPTNGMIVRPFE